MKSPFSLPTQIILSLGRLLLRGMFNIVFALEGRNRDLTKSIFHLLVSLSISVDTIGKSLKSFGGEITLYVEGVGNHLSSQI